MNIVFFYLRFNYCKENLGFVNKKKDEFVWASFGFNGRMCKQTLSNMTFLKKNVINMRLDCNRLVKIWGYREKVISQYIKVAVL